METLGKIFDSEARVKIMRLFLFNPGSAYGAAEIVERAKVTDKEAKKELDILERAGLIKSRRFVDEVALVPNSGKSAGKKFVSKKKKLFGWTLDDKYMYLAQLQSLIINTILMKEDEIVRRISQLGKVKLIVLSGVFIQHWDSRADILVVGDHLRENQLQAIIKKMEAEIGRELSYAVLETSDFQYRMSVCDKLVRDILDYPHRVILNKMGIKLAF